MFDLPQHTIPHFLLLASKENIAENLFLWATCMDSFSTPGFIKTGVNQFKTQGYMFQVGVDSDSAADMVDLWRGRLLTEFFDGEVSINTGVADRLVVDKTDDGWCLRYESIGRMRDWQWINQGRGLHFHRNDPQRLMRAIAESYNDPYNMSTGAEQ